MELYKLTAHEARDLLRKREVSSCQLTEASIKQIERLDNSLGAFLAMNEEMAFKQAQVVDRCIAKGDQLPDLAGIPVGIKDNICTYGLKTTCASKILGNFVPPYDATVIKRIREQKAIIVGKLNMDEFAMGSSNENSAFGKTYNPWDLTRVPGGSSGGGAAAVASDEVFYALGSDTGGSIRQPAAMCGVVGMKPTYGMVSRYGLIAYASSLDQIGPITKDVTDCALVMNAITGYDDADSTSVKMDYPDYRKALVDDVKGLKIGVPKEAFGKGLNTEVRRAVEKAISILEGLGAGIVDISLPYTDYALAAYYIIACAEASSNLARYDGIKYGYRSEKYEDLADLYEKSRSQGFGTEVKRRIILGNYVLSSGYYDAYYLKALKVRTLILQDYKKAFEKCDVILTPTSPTTAFKIGEKSSDPMEMYMSDVYTVPINIAGLPAMSIPCGYDDNGLPIGMQLIGNLFGESTILRAAYTFEQNTDFHIKRPCVEWGELNEV